MPASTLQRRFTDYTAADFEQLSKTNLKGYIYITQLAVKQMLVQKTGGSVICVASAMVEYPIARVKASVAMITKGGLDAITRSLAMEYAKEGIRFNAVAPGAVDTPLQTAKSKDLLKSLSPMGMIQDVDDIVDAIIYLTEARQVTGEVLHVDAGTHNGMVNNAEDRLAAAGVELPQAVTPFGSYVPAVRTGNLVFLSGMLPTVGHEPKFVGRVGKELSTEQGRNAAYAAALIYRS